MARRLTWTMSHLPNCLTPADTCHDTCVSGGSNIKKRHKKRHKDTHVENRETRTKQEKRLKENSSGTAELS